MNKYENAEKLSTAIDMVDEKYLTEAAEYKAEKHGIRHSRLVAVAVAAVVCVFMMGAGVLVSNEGISDWLRTQQELISGREMSEEQYEQIQDSAQYIGASESASNMTITVDSATFTDERIYILLRIEGSEERQPLLNYDVNLYGIFAEKHSCGVAYDGIHDDGATYYVIDFVYDYIGEPDATEVDVTLEVINPDDDNAMSWTFDFTLDRVPETAIDIIPEGESVTVSVSMRYMDWAAAATTDVITEIRYDVITRDVIAISLREGAMYVTYDNDTAILPDGVDVDKYYIDTEYDGGFDSIYVVMKDGTMIKPTYGGMTESALGQPTITWRYIWSSAINPDNVAYIRIGYTDIPVNVEASSVTDGDVTVTVEKTVADESNIYLLLRVESDVIEGSCENMNFGDCQLVADGASISSVEYITMESDEDGVYYVLLRNEYTLTDPDATALDCTLELGNLHTNYLELDDTIISGDWDFTFNVERNNIDTLSLTADAPGISELEISEFGCTFTYDYTISDSSWAPNDVTIVTKSGEEIHTASAEIEYYREDVDGVSKIITGYKTFIWETTVTLDEVDYICFTGGFETDGVVVEVQ
ncbi:MAG: DUF4179 domain-containing protein [Oscillospiraceae bacterium]|nr:DUF4179 domain-containing protein [Oscillospiraceae bacterium]